MISVILTAFATLVLVLHVSDIHAVASIASDPTTRPRTRGGDLVHAIGGLIVLLIPLWLNMYKPRGL